MKKDEPKNKKKRLSLSPSVVDLREVYREGRDFSYTQESGELTENLKDLVGTNPFSVDIHIAPLGNAYEITGVVKTELNLLCSRCGIDFKYPVQERFRELLVVSKDLPRQGKEARVNHSSELDPQGPNVTLLTDESFNVGQFAREIIGLAEPVQPLGKPDCDDSCENLQEAYKKGWLKKPGDPKEDVAQSHNPFQALKGVKLDS